MNKLFALISTTLLSASAWGADDAKPYNIVYGNEGAQNVRVFTRTGETGEEFSFKSCADYAGSECQDIAPTEWFSKSELETRYAKCRKTALADAQKQTGIEVAEGLFTALAFTSAGITIANSGVMKVFGLAPITFAQMQALTGLPAAFLAKILKYTFKPIEWLQPLNSAMNIATRWDLTRAADLKLITFTSGTSSWVLLDDSIYNYIPALRSVLTEGCDK